MRVPEPVEPRTATRAEAQRERILCAAQKCFIEHGFQGAGMALIAETADMSPGLIYRYFESKNAIVLAIAERQLREGRQQIGRLQSSADLAADILETFRRWQERDPHVMNPALFLETSAAATRDPQIAQSVANFDEQIRVELEALIRRGHGDEAPPLPDDVVEARAILLQCVFDGLAVRAVRQPQAKSDKLVQAVCKLATRLLTAPPESKP
jgi:AcrR family transcriptional regulator